MKSDHDRAQELVRDLLAQLPIPMTLSSDTLVLLRKKKALPRRGATLMLDTVFYPAPETGIWCGVKERDNAESVIVLPLTRVILPATHALTRRVAAYCATRDAETDALLEKTLVARVQMSPPTTKQSMPSSLNQARRQKQIAVTWQCMAGRAPAWVDDDDGKPYRPYQVIIVQDDHEVVRLHSLQDERPTAQDVFAALVEAMVQPLANSGPRCRPKLVWLDDRDLVRVLSPLLGDLGIQCAYRAELTLCIEATRSAEAALTVPPVYLPALASATEIPRAWLADYYRAAASFHRMAPWERFSSDELIEIRYPADAAPKYGVVMGSHGETFGLAIYHSLEEADLALSVQHPEEIKPGMKWLMMVFEEQMLLPFEDLDDIENNQRPIAAPNAYPLLAAGAPPNLEPLSADQLRFMSAAAVAIANLTNALNERPKMGLSIQATIKLDGAFGGDTVVLQYPVRSAAGETADADALDRMIADWRVTETQMPFARALSRLMVRFVREELVMRGLAEETIARHANNCFHIGLYLCQHHGNHEFSPELISMAPVFVDLFRQQVSAAPSRVRAYEATWRKLARYARQEQWQ